MKIRTGFVSNSSSSSFMLVYLPDDFDFDTHLEYLIDTNKNKKFPFKTKITENAINNFIKRKVLHEQDDDSMYSEMWDFLYKFKIFGNEVEEGNGSIELASKKSFLEKINNIDKLTTEINSKYKDSARERKERREILKDKMKNIDPYGEEDWDD